MISAACWTGSLSRKDFETDDLMASSLPLDSTALSACAFCCLAESPRATPSTFHRNRPLSWANLNRTSGD